MRDIQSVASEILGGHPTSMYIFCGNEYGLKNRYITALKQYYDNNYFEYDSVSDVISELSHKNLFSISDSLYIVRYDKVFLSSLSFPQNVRNFKSKSIRGTLVLIYDSEEDTLKCDRYFENETVVINNVSDKLVEKYLRSDIPDMPDRCYKLASNIGKNYGHAKQIIYAMNSVSDIEIWNKLENYDILTMFAKTSLSDNDDFRLGVASRNCTYLYSKLDDYVGDYNNILYCVLQTLVELEKLLSVKQSDSNIFKYISKWNISDIYNMFMTTYSELSVWRKYSLNYKDRLIYIFSLLKFKSIPYLEVAS